MGGVVLINHIVVNAGGINERLLCVAPIAESSNNVSFVMGDFRMSDIELSFEAIDGTTL